MRYTATYKAPKSAGGSGGKFEFESEGRAGSKRNATDARVRMLEEFGNEALSWSIDKVERMKAS